MSGKARILVDSMRSSFSDNPVLLVNLGRVGLAFCFSALVAFFQPGGRIAAVGVLALLVVYSIFAICVAVVGVRSWWTGARLASVVGLFDWGIFLVLLLLADGYESLCAPFFLLLLASSGHRLGWSRTFSVGLGLGLLLVSVSYILAADAGSIGLTHLFLRMIALAMLALMIASFYRKPEFERQFAGWRENLLREAMHQYDLPLPLMLARIQSLFKADRILFAWHDVGAGRSRMVVYERDEPNERSCTSEEFSWLQRLPIDGDGSFLFDGVQGHVLARLSNRHGMAVAVEGFAKLVDPPLTRGVCITIVCQAVVGRMFIVREEGVSESDFGRAEAARMVMEAVLDRYQLVDAIRENAFSKAQLALARNIHDGVIQNLAGFAMRFGAMKLDLTAGRVTEALDEIDMLQSLLKQEQIGLRTLIQRDQEKTEDRCNVVPLLREMAPSLTQQWRIHCSVSAFPDPIMIPSRLGSDVSFIIREAVANAVRHARATWVRVSVAIDEDALKLLIASDRNLEVSIIDDTSEPRSLSMRLEHLGGSVILTQKATGTRLTAFLPTNRN